MIEQRLSKAFHDAVERLRNGQSLEHVLREYPDLADQLRPLLETVLAVPNARVDRAEIQAMRSRLNKRFEDRLVALEFPQQRPRNPLLPLVLLVGLLGLGSGFFLLRGQTPEPIDLLPTATVTVTASPTPTMIPPTRTPSPIPTATLPTPTSEGCVLRTDWEQYRLESGDTLSQIALDSGSTVDELLLANCLENPRTLLVGQMIYVPRLWENRSNTSGGSPSNNPPSDDDIDDDDDADDGGDD
jgi:hypothetical protein